VREPDKILEETAQTLDLTRRTALMLLNILGFVPEDEARSIIKRLMAALPSGSYLVHCDGAAINKKNIEATQEYNKSGAGPYILRSRETIARFFDGLELELLEPGIVDVTQWRSEPAPSGQPGPVFTFCGVGRKP
jgi:hypothetical protein